MTSGILREVRRPETAIRAANLLFSRRLLRPRLIIECSNCHSKYQYDEQRFERRPSKRIKCAKCQHIFEIFNPALPKEPASAPPGDDTSMKRAVPKPVEKPELRYEPPPPAPDLATGTPPLQMPQGKRLSLAIIDGPDAGSVFRIEKTRVTVGRAGADLALNDTEASRQHAAVEVHDTICMLLDLGSTNGTILEGEKISGPTELQNHSEFLVGSSTLMLIVTEEA